MTTEFPLAKVEDVRTILREVVRQRKTSLNALMRAAGISNALLTYVTASKSVTDIQLRPVLAALEAGGYEVVVRPKSATTKRAARVALASQRGAQKRLVQPSTEETA